MPKKTNIVDGACFGYFDRTFEDCRKCKAMSSCYCATNSEQVAVIRAIPKLTNTVVDQLVESWKPEKPITIEEIDARESHNANL